MYIPNDDTLDYPFCRLQLIVETFGNGTQWIKLKLTNVSKVIKPTNKKTLSLNFGD